MSKSKHPLAGLSGGSDGNGNGNDKGNGRDKSHTQAGQQQEKADKTHIPIYKYTANFKKPLHEAILFNGEPFFIAYDPEKKFIGLVRDIEETKRVLNLPIVQNIPTNI